MNFKVNNLKKKKERQKKNKPTDALNERNEANERINERANRIGLEVEVFKEQRYRIDCMRFIPILLLHFFVPSSVDVGFSSFSSSSSFNLFFRSVRLEWPFEKWNYTIILLCFSFVL